MHPRRLNSNSQTMHSNISSYDAYAPPLVSTPSTFDDFLSMQQQPPPLPPPPPHTHWSYDRNYHFGVLPRPAMPSFPDIPPATSFHFHRDSNDHDAFIGYNHCARIDAVDTACRDYNPIPPPIDNAQSIEPNHSFCSETSNSTVATNSSASSGGFYSLSHQPAPIYQFRIRSDYKNVSNQIYEDDLSSTSCASFNSTLPSDHTVKTESSTGVTKKEAKNAKPWECPECLRRYKYKSSMKLHFKVHTKDAKICKECGKKFPHEHKLRIHMRSHTGERPYKCELCPKAFSDKSNLNRHKRLHTGEKPYQCEYCQRRYSDSSALVDHRRRKHTKEKPYQCQFCFKTFAASSDLTSHLAVHSNIRPFECEQCHKRFKRRSDVHKHMKTHQSKV